MASIGSAWRQRSYIRGRKSSSSRLETARCFSTESAPCQQSQGPPGYNWNTMRWPGPLGVSVGTMMFSPAPGTTLKQTPSQPGRGATPVTATMATNFRGFSNGDSSGTRRNRLDVSPLPAAIITRSCASQ